MKTCRLTLLFVCCLTISNFAWAQTSPVPVPATLTFAAVADIQYADKVGVGTRHYRSSPAKVQIMATELAKMKPAPAFIIHLGDLTDGRKMKVHALQDINTIMASVKAIPLHWRYVLGNHDAAAGRDLFTQATGIKDFYYEFTEPAAKGWRFVVLDGNDAGYGIIGKKQLSWFASILDQAKAAHERVICFCHYPLIKEASPRNHRMAEPKPLLDLLDASGCVVAWIAGHDHSGGYALRKEVHHLTLQGTVETRNEPAFAIIRLFPNHLSITGFGRVPSRELAIATP